MSREGALLLLVLGRQLVSLTPCRCRKALLIGVIVMHWFETQLTTSEMPKEGALHHLSTLLINPAFWGVICHHTSYRKPNMLCAHPRKLAAPEGECGFLLQATMAHLNLAEQTR